MDETTIRLILALTVLAKVFSGCTRYTSGSVSNLKAGRWSVQA